jgi:hypothetical protein
MKITIDTNQDSKEDIKKAIRMLQALVEGTSSYHTPTYDSAPDLPEGENVFGGMFDGHISPENSDSEEEDSEDFSLNNIQTY